jgi:hypothetical protein
LVPKSQRLRVVYWTYRYTITYPGKTPKCFFRRFGNQICASRTFTSYSNNFIINKSEGKQSDDSEISATTQGIALFLKHNRSLDQKVSQIFSFIVGENNLFAAWLEIKSNSGTLVSRSGFMNKVLDNLSMDLFSKASRDILNGSYYYKPARYVRTFKAKMGCCPLIILSLLDKIIQKAFFRVLDIIFEGFYQWSNVNKKTYYDYLPLKFDPTQNHRFIKDKKYLIKEWIVPSVFEYISFGFRKNLGVHSALQHIQLFWYPICWFSSCGIEKVFDHYNYHILINELKLEVNDQKLEDEIWKMLRAKTLYFSARKELSPETSFPQGSVLSPLLFNVFMHRFDKFFLKLKRKSVSPFVVRVNNLKNPRSVRINSSEHKGFPFHIKQKSAYAKKKFHCNNFRKSSFSFKIYCARYVDNLLFGFDMPRKQVIFILNEIQVFFKSNLQLNVKSFCISYARSEKTFFLGFFLRSCSGDVIFKDKGVERFQRLKARILRRHSLEYQRYLNLIEFLGKKAIRGFATLSLKEGQHRLSKFEIVNFLPQNLKKASWFEENFKFINKPFSLAISDRNKELNFRLEKWLNTCYALVDSPELLEFSKLVGEDVGNDILKSRANLIRSLKKAFQINRTNKIVFKRSRELFFSRAVFRSAKCNKSPDRVWMLAPKDVILTMLQNKGVLGQKFAPISCVSLISHSELNIIEWFSRVARGLLFFYCCAKNFYDVKKIVKWQLKYSLFATLGQKHKKSISWVIRKFGKNQPKVVVNDKVVAAFPANGWVNSLSKKFNVSSHNFCDINFLIQLGRCQSNLFFSLFHKCGMHYCLFKADHIHQVKMLQRAQSDNMFSVVGLTNKRPLGFKVTVFTFKSKQIPLCSDCYVKFHKGKLTLSDLDRHFLDLI